MLNLFTRNANIKLIRYERIYQDYRKDYWIQNQVYLPTASLKVEKGFSMITYHNKKTKLQQNKYKEHNCFGSMLAGLGQTNNTENHAAWKNWHSWSILISK